MGRTRQHMERLRRHATRRLYSEMRDILLHQINHIVKSTRRVESLSRLRRFIAAKKIVNFINRYYRRRNEKVDSGGLFA